MRPQASCPYRAQRGFTGSRRHTYPKSGGQCAHCTRGKEISYSSASFQRQSRSSACRRFYILHKTAARPGISGTAYHKQSDRTSEIFSEGSSVSKTFREEFFLFPERFHPPPGRRHAQSFPFIVRGIIPVTVMIRSESAI